MINKEHAPQVAESVIRYLRWKYRNHNLDEEMISVDDEKPTSITALIEDLQRLTSRGEMYADASLDARCELAAQGKLWGEGFITEEELQAIEWVRKGRRDSMDGKYEHRPHHPHFKYYLEAYREHQKKPSLPKRKRGKPQKVNERKYRR